MWDKNKEKYSKALDLCDEFDLKGKTMPYTSSNTYMFSSLNKAGKLGVRLSELDTEEYQKEYTEEHYISHGAKIKEHVLITQELLNNAEELSKWLKKGFNYVNTLKPK